MCGNPFEPVIKTPPPTVVPKPPVPPLPGASFLEEDELLKASRKSATKGTSQLQTQASKSPTINFPQ